jgi:Cu+-exporting ATPase
MEKIDLKIEGMSCASCASSIERETGKLPFIQSSQVNYAMETGSFLLKEGNEPKTSLLKIEEVISGLGFKALEKTQEKPADNKLKEKDNFYKFFIALILSLALFALAMWPLMGWPSQKVNWYLQLILCAPIYFWIGWKFQASLLRFLKTGHSNMNTLVGLGTTAAFIYSSLLTLATEKAISWGLVPTVYFEAVGFIICFIYLGQYFEEKAKKKTKEALNSLFKLTEKKALLIKDDGVVEIDVSLLQVGDIIRVKSGASFPVDGTVIKGMSSVDESMVTGESIPVLKQSGDQVMAGTINGGSPLDFKAKKVGSNTFLSQIIHYVEEAQNSKPEIQKYADRISAIFVPSVIVIAVITFLAWFFLGPEPVWGTSVSNLIAVLVIACPCALGLATPTAVVVATGNASLKGILISGGEVLEKANNIDVIVFDKTGTVTVGKPSVIEEVYDNSINRNDLLRAVASIEQFSEHPLSKAVVNLAEKESLDLDEPDLFETVKGKGIKAEFEDNDFLLGNESLLTDNNIELNKTLAIMEVGSLIYVAKEGKHVATLVIGDDIKEESLATINEMRERGITTWMITGDNQSVADHVGKKLGIDHVLAHALPVTKAEKIKEFQSQGLKVAMVGDGVNDAPALAQADLSMAMGTGTDVAMSTADVTLVHGDLKRALDFLRLGEGTMTIIKQNLFLSLVYNSVLIPIAAGLLVPFGGPMMPPVLASIAMALSSVSVVSNSLRIKNIRL